MAGLRQVRVEPDCIDRRVEHVFGDTAKQRSIVRRKQLEFDLRHRDHKSVMKL